MPKCIESRLAMLEATQNSDGGWGYFPGKQSWLEPTAYALLALSGDARCRPAFERGWRTLGAWQAPGGGWRAGAAVNEVHWATSLAVTLHSMAGVYDGAFRRGIEWLLASTGAESRLVSRLAHWLQPSEVEFDPELSGWPWQTGASSWIEPTAHALIALRRAARRVEHGGLAARIHTGERMFLERRCRDGGWNYGNRRVLGADLPSYPETTALALIALDGHASVQWAAALDRVQQLWMETTSPLARAWLAACLLIYRGERPQEAERAPTGNDILVAAVEAIAWDRIAAI